jgi:hypothetical protein
MIRAVIEKVYRDFTIIYSKKPGDLYGTCGLARQVYLYGVFNLQAIQVKERTHVTRTMFCLPQSTCVLWPCSLHTKLPLFWKPQSTTHTISVTKTKYILWFIQIYHKEGYVLCMISSFCLELHCSWLLCSEQWQFLTDVLGQPIGPILKFQVEFLTLEDGTDKLSQKVG